MKLKIISLSLKLTGVLLLLTLLMVSCTNDDAAGESSTGTLSVRLTDAPFPTDAVAEANVTINKIEARQKAESSEESFIILAEEEVSFNLLDLTNGITASLAELEVPVGTYDLVRLYVADAEIVLKDGSTFKLKVPSGSQSGIKVFIDPSIEVAGGLTSELLLDFDVARSFVVKGNVSNPVGFNFKPVIKASNLSTAGRLVGTLTDSLDAAADGAQVTIYAADTMNTSTFADSLGSYAVLGLSAGTYTVSYSYSSYDSVVVEDVKIVAGNATTSSVQFGAIESDEARIAEQLTKEN